MTRSGLIFDDRGNVWPTGNEDLRRHLASDLPTAALSERLIAKSGYIRLCRLSYGIRMELQADRVSDAAYASVMHWLADHPQARVILASEPGGTVEELTGRPAEVESRLAACIQATRARAEPRLHRLRLEPSALDKNSPLRIFRQLWQHGVEPADAGFSSACDRLFHGRYVLTERTSSGDLVIREHGSGYVAYSNAYLSRCVGLRIEDDPDMEYGLWNRDAYREAMRDWCPLIEDLDVRVRGAGEVRRHIRYQRIIAPLSGRHGRAFLLSASVLASTRPIEPELT